MGNITAPTSRWIQWFFDRSSRCRFLFFYRSTSIVCTPRVVIVVVVVGIVVVTVLSVSVVIATIATAPALRFTNLWTADNDAVISQ